jgi:hypothetical protein
MRGGLQYLGAEPDRKTGVLATWYICSRIMREKYELKVYYC